MNERVLRPPPSPEALHERLDPRVLRIARAVEEAGGRALLVGGFVRDWLLGRPSKDLDVEVFGLSLADLERILSAEGRLRDIGRSFGVLRTGDLDVDFSLPRRDHRTGAGHRGFRAQIDPSMTPEEAARRRDLRVNALSLDPLEGTLVDPLGGIEDLRRGVLRACDPSRFGEDPLRALRVVQLAARLEMEPDAELLALCAAQTLDDLSPERVFDEWRKLLLRASRPSIGLRLLEKTGLLAFWPSLDALRGVPQDPAWHPEGDVFTHTCWVVDEAAGLRRAEHEGGPVERSLYEEDAALMFGAMAHDLGKATTTKIDDEGRVRSPAHDVAGVPLATAWLESLRAPGDLVERVAALTRHHLAPALYDKQGAGDRAYRKLARRLDRARVSPALLERLARADHFGRATADAQAHRFPAGDRFLQRMDALDLQAGAPPDVVRGRDLLARGYAPGPEIGALLRRCRAVQDRTGWTDAARILAEVLGEDQPPRPPSSEPGPE